MEEIPALPREMALGSSAQERVDIRAKRSRAKVGKIRSRSQNQCSGPGLEGKEQRSGRPRPQQGRLIGLQHLQGMGMAA